MKFKLGSFIALILLFLNLNLIIACSTIGKTKPNPPFEGTYPDKFNQIIESDPLLAKEIGKLPEIRDGISESEAIALDQLCELYYEDPASFDHAFEKMYQIGIPEVRKYNSPLQALFWMAEDGKLKKDDGTVDTDIIKNYKLVKLLDKGWSNNYNWSQYFTPDEKKTILAGTKNKIKRSMYNNYFRNVDEATVRALEYDNNNDRNNFNSAARRAISKAGKRFKKEDYRWNDYRTVLERLNSPELLDFYINQNFEYAFAQSQRKALSVFNNKIGDCDDLAYFGQRTLSKAGYKTHARFVNVGVGHIGLAVEENSKYYLAVDFRPWGNNLSESFNSLEQIDLILSNYKCTGSRHEFN